MQLNLETDYAIRCLLYLAEKKTYVSSGELTEKLGFRTPGHAQKILRKLRDANLVMVQRGTTGGYALKRKASEIALGDVLSVMEDTMCINRCLESDGFCSRRAQKRCPLRRYYSILQGKLNAAFRNVSILDVLEERFE